MTRPYIVTLAYPGLTGVRCKTHVTIAAGDPDSAVMAAIAFFYSERPELKHRKVRLASVANTGFSYEGPVLDDVVPVTWAYDREAPHKGANAHKKGKWVTYQQREESRRKRKRRKATSTVLAVSPDNGDQS